jgi:Flp pilus assembly protein TadG
MHFVEVFMLIVEIWTRALAAVRRFRSAQRGNVAVTFAFATLPIIAVVGAAIDFSQANAIKADMQAALDSTALTLSKKAASMTDTELQADAQQHFTALFDHPKVTNINVAATYSSTTGSSLVVSATASVPTDVMTMFGDDSITIRATSTAKWGLARLRVALVLDNTGSMADDGKMTALKTATTNMLSQLQSAAAANGDIYVSIVPFVKDVNLDPTNYNADWIDWTNWNTKNGSCSAWGYHSQNSCNYHGGTWSPASHDTWNGCVVDRGGQYAPDSANYDTNVVEPTTSITATLFSAEQYSSCPQAAMGLSYDWSAMSSLVDNMSPAGNTNQAIGLALGWMSLAGGGPFTVPAKTPGYTYHDAIVILTDGMNTQDRWYNDQSSIDAREQMTCDNIKAAGITIYTVQVNTGSDPTSTLLQNCASSSDKFYLLTSANQIVSAFNTIGTNLTKLYIAQ